MIDEVFQSVELQLLVLRLMVIAGFVGLILW